MFGVAYIFSSAIKELDLLKKINYWQRNYVFDPYFIGL